MAARVIEETSIMAAPIAEPDLEATSTMPAVVIPETAGLADAIGLDSAEPALETAIEPVAANTSPAEASTDSEPVVALSSNSTVKDAASLKAALIDVVASSATVAIDVRSVERIDTAALQLLCAFVRERAKRQLGVKWLDCPKAFLEASRLLGVNAILGLPEAGVA
jgi:ABC-type transporter Mla MlaB component